MRRTILLLTLMGAVLLACTGVVLAQTTTPSNQQSGGQAPLQKAQGKPVPGQYIVVLKDDVADADQVSKKHGADEGFTPDLVYKKALKGYAAKLSDAQLSKVRSKPEVEFVSLDQEVQAVEKKKTSKDSKQSSGSEQSSTTQDSSSKQPANSNQGATTESVNPTGLVTNEKNPTGVVRINDATGTSSTAVHPSSDVAVAVIDTGIDLTHPDLNAQSGTNCVNPGTNAQDDNGHGTHVSGTIGAKNTGSGVVGVAPGTQLYAAKVLDSTGSGTWSQVICGIDWVTNNAAAKNIKVASMSLGGSGSSDGTNCGIVNNDALHKAICDSTKAGVTYVVAAGNSSTNLSGFTPAAYPQVLAVTAASDSDGKSGGTGGAPTCRSGEKDDYYASFSNYADSSDIPAQNHTIAGPGVCINSTWLNGGYNTISGTSMATPHLSGTVALCLGNGGTSGPCAGMTPEQIIQKLRTDAQAHATATNGFFGDPNNRTTTSCNKRGKCNTITAPGYFGFLAYDGGY